MDEQKNKKSADALLGDAGKNVQSRVEIFQAGEYNASFSDGRVAEWPIAAVLKTAVGQPTVGSNPTSSDK